MMTSKLAALALLLVAACTSVETAPNATDADADTMLYTCQTRSGCDGTIVEEQHRLCAHASAADVVVVGDAAARDWETITVASCVALEGGSDPSDARTCTDEGGRSAAPYLCRAQCVAQYSTCN